MDTGVIESKQASNITKSDTIIIPYENFDFLMNVESVCHKGADGNNLTQCLICTKLDKQLYSKYFQEHQDINEFFNYLHESYPAYLTDFLDVRFLCYGNYNFNVVPGKKNV